MNKTFLRWNMCQAVKYIYLQNRQLKHVLNKEEYFNKENYNKNWNKKLVLID